MFETITNEVREFIIANFLFGQRDNFDDQQSFLESGIIDSTGLLELVAHLEQHYEISIADRELLPENLDSLANVSRFVNHKLEAKEARIAG